MDLDTVEVLRAVARAGSISTAAAGLGVTQQAVSARLAVAERSAGTALVRRSATGSRLTPAGLVVLELAEPLLEASDRLEAGVRALSAPTGAVTIAASQTIAEMLVPDWLVQLRADHPEVRVRLVAGNTAEVLAEVRDGRSALGFIEGPDVPDDLRSEAIAVDELVVVVAPGHPWATTTSISAADLGRTALLVREVGSGTRAVLEHALGAAGSALSPPAGELSGTAVIRASARAGIAPAVLSRRSVQSDLDDGRLVPVPLDGRPLRRTFTAVWAHELDGVGRTVLAVARTTS
jgi:DNA-binding transcriptional LysR family regulator